MSTATATPEAPAILAASKPRRVRAREADQCVILPAIGWDGYRRILKLKGERRLPRMIYLDGDLYLMSPGHLHETDRDRFGMFVVEVAVALSIPFHSAGSMTYRRRTKKGGVEPARSYYFANAHRVQHKKDIDLSIDPPPDLSIEVVYSNSAAAALEVSRRLGIPEVWVSTEKGLTFLLLGASGKYAESATSLAMPLLSAPEILGWVRRPLGEGESELEWIQALRRWAEEILVPRAVNRAE